MENHFWKVKQSVKFVDKNFAYSLNYKQINILNEIRYN